MVESRSSIQREGVYRWFSTLTSAQRVEFLCGLLDLCVPIELRFLGSCLEDLARKDYHSLRDAEIKANNPTDLSGLTNITDEVVRSKLLVSLALLGSENREAAGVLYRTLTHIDTVINNYGLALNDGRTEEQFLLLFTMASNHPAFSFHQKQILRQQLSQIQDILQVSSREAGEAQGPAADCPPQPQRVPQASLSPSACSVPDASATYLPLSTCQPCHTHCTCWHKSSNRVLTPVPGGRGDQGVTQNLSSHLDVPPPSPLPPALPAVHNQDAPTSAKSHQVKTTKVIIDRVVLRGVTPKSEDTTELIFEAQWSDGFVSSVVRTEQEVTELLTQLSQAFPNEGVEKFLPQSIDPRCLSTLPPHMLQHHSVQLFFTSTRPLSPQTASPSPLPPLPSSPSTASITPTSPVTCSSNPGFMVQYKGLNRAVYKVASVLPVVSTHSSVMTRLSHPLSSIAPPLPQAFPHPQLSPLPPPHPSDSSSHPPAQLQPGALLQPHSYPQLHLQTPACQPSAPLSHSQSLSYSQSHSQSLSYSHFHARPSSQLLPAQSQASTPEQNGILDWLRKLRLHKYYPVFKQLTMEEFLALTEEDLNKYDLTQGAKKKLKTQLELQKSVDREMKMEKRLCSGVARVPPSGYMGPSTHSTCNTGELRVEVEAVVHPPVSTDSSSSSGYSSSPCSPRTPLCCDSTDRTRDFHRRVSGPDSLSASPEKERSSFYILNSSCTTSSARPTAQVLPVQTDPPFSIPQSSFPPQASFPQQSLLSPLSNPARIMTSPRKPRPPLPLADDRPKPLAFGAGFGTGVGVRLETLFPGLNMDGSAPGLQQDSVVCHGVVSGSVGLMVETSSALTSTSNSHHHVSHPPLHFHLSSSSPPTASGPYSCPLVSSCPTSKSQTGLMTTGTVPRSNYYSPTSSPSPSSAPSLDCGTSDHTPSACVCSSCGCRGNCGAYGALPGYATAGYLQQFTPGPSLFTLGPLLHLSPLIASSSSTGNGGTPFPYPMMVPPVYRHSPQSHDLQQSHYHSMLGNVGQKQVAGNVSCYNCGASGHRAEDCKQPSMDSAQQGMFRLRYTSHTDTKDSGD